MTKNDLMKSVFKIIFPNQADNKYIFNKAIVYIFAAVSIITLIRSLAHIFLADGGANSIASIIQFGGGPDPDQLVYHLFALWGLAQLAMALIYLIVLWKYKKLIPLMWIFIFCEYSFRIIIAYILKPLGQEYFLATAPGEVGNYILMPFSVFMLIWTIKSSQSRLAL